MTSDERRRVAERLRDEAEDFRRIGEECDDVWTVDLGDVPAIFQDIAHYVGFDGTVRADALFDRLADLIDPMCHIVCVDDTYNTPETGCVDDWHYECSKCGIELDDNDTDAMDSGVKPFDYCHNCGARVVADGARHWRDRNGDDAR